MKIFDAVYTAAVFLQLDGLCDAMNAEDFNREDYKTSLFAENAAELEILVRCCNLVLGELSSSEFPLKKCANTVSKDGRIEYSSLPEKITDIYCVLANGKSLPFAEYYDCVTVPYSGECVVTYSFAPRAVTLSSVSPYVGNKPSARLTAYGIAREYCLISGMTDDAALWDSRFVACVEEEARGRGSKVVRPRKWF